VKNYARYRVRLLELVGLTANRDKILLLRAKVKGGRSAVTASNLVNSRGEGKRILSSSTEKLRTLLVGRILLVALHVASTLWILQPGP